MEVKYRWKPVRERCRSHVSVPAINTSPAAAKALTVTDRACRTTKIRSGAVYSVS